MIGPYIVHISYKHLCRLLIYFIQCKNSQVLKATLCSHL